MELPPSPDSLESKSTTSVLNVGALNFVPGAREHGIAWSDPSWTPYSYVPEPQQYHCQQPHSQQQGPHPHAAQGQHCQYPTALLDSGGYGYPMAPYAGDRYDEGFDGQLFQGEAIYRGGPVRSRFNEDYTQILPADGADLPHNYYDSKNSYGGNTGLSNSTSHGSNAHGSATDSYKTKKPKKNSNNTAATKKKFNGDTAKKPVKWCTYPNCGRRGHLESECWIKQRDENGDTHGSTTPDHDFQYSKMCTYPSCGRRGHLEAECHQKKRDLGHGCEMFEGQRWCTYALCDRPTGHWEESCWRKQRDLVRGVGVGLRADAVHAPVESATLQW